MTEVELTQQIIRFLRTCGCFCWKNWGGPLGRKGISDILGVLPGGRMLAIEVKTDRGKVSSHQVTFIEDVRKFGGMGFFARSVSEVRNRLEQEGIRPKQMMLFE